LWPLSRDEIYSRFFNLQIVGFSRFISTAKNWVLEKFFNYEREHFHALRPNMGAVGKKKKHRKKFFLYFAVLKIFKIVPLKSMQNFKERRVLQNLQWRSCKLDKPALHAPIN